MPDVHSPATRDGETASLTFRLTADPLALDAVVVSGTFNAASELASSPHLDGGRVRQHLGDAG